MKLHSSRSHREDVRDVFEGRKPVALVDSDAARYGEDLGLVVEPVPEGTFSYLRSKLAYVVYRPEDPESAERLFKIFGKYPIGMRGELWHRELGEALGYPREDIDFFVEKFKEMYK